MKNIFWALSFLLIFSNVTADTIGSNTTVSRHTNVVFPENPLLTSNVIRGFAWVNGFSFQNSDTECTFEGVFPVTGNIDLNGGTLQVDEDLVFTNQTQLLGLGNIVGNGSTVLDLCASINSLPSDTNSFQDIRLFLSGDLIVSSTINFIGDCIIDARNNTINLSTDGAFVVDSNSTLKIINARIENIQDQNMQCADDTGVIIFDTVACIFSGDFTFANGSITYIDQVDFLGNFIFAYESVLSSTISSRSTLQVVDDMEFRLGISGQLTRAKPLYFEDETSVARVSNAKLHVLDSGLDFTRGVIEFAGAALVDIDSTSTENGIVIGSGVLEDDMRLKFGPGAILTYNSGHMLFNNASPFFIEAGAHKSSRILRKVNAHFNINQDLIFPNMSVEVDSFFATSNVITPGKTVSFANSEIILPGVEFDFIGTQINGTTYMLAGDGLVFLNRGTFLFGLLVAGTGNQILGSGNLLSPVVLNDGSAELGIGIDGLFFSDISLSGGTVALSSNLKLGAGVTFVGPGMINLGTYVLESGPISVSYADPIMFTGTAGELSLRSNISLSSTWTIDSNCTIQGNDNHIVLSGDGEIVVTDGSTLTLKKVSLENIKNSNIRCLGDDAKIIFEDTMIIQDGDYAFDTGSFSCSNNLSFIGTHTFVYSSSRTSTINSNSSLHITEGVHFCLGKINDSDPLYFEDDTSVLNMDQSSLIIANEGINLTRGKLMFNRFVPMEMLGTTSETGMVWGNGVADDDLVIQFNPGSTVNHVKGYLVYKNTDPKGIKSPSQDARYLRQIESRIRIEENLEFPDFTGETGVVGVPQAEVVVGKQLTFDNLRVVAPVAEFNVIGSLYAPGVYLLNGSSDELFMAKGTLPLGIVINGVGNKIRGNGSLSGPIILLSSSADFTLGLNGGVLSNITLNGGNLTLGGSLSLGTNKFILGPGGVDLATYALSIGQKDSQWVTPLNWNSSGGSINLNARLDLKETWTFNGSCTINGNGNILDLTDLGKIIVDSGAQLTLKDVSIRNVQGTNIKCVDDSGSIVLDNASYLLDGNYTFSNGSMEFVGGVDFSGGHCFIYDSSQSSTLDVLSELRIGLGLDFNIGKKTQGSLQDPVVCAGATSILRLNNCTLSIREHGARIIKGKIICERDIVVDIVSTDTNSGLNFGDGTPDNDMIFELSPGASVRFINGAVVYDITSGNGIQSRSKSARFYRGATSHTHFKHSLTLAEMKLEADELAMLTFEPGKFLLYDNTVISADDGSFNITGTRLNFAVNQLGGNQSIFLNKGNLLFYTSVGGTGNTMFGNGNVLGQILLQGPTAELIYGINGFVANHIALNGGSIALVRNMDLASGILINGPGNFILGSNQLNIGPSKVEWPTTLAINGTSGTICLHANLDLSETWTIDGICTIDGGGHILEFKSNGSIELAQGASLIFKNIQLRGIQNQNLSCLDDDGSIVLDDVLWLQNDDFTFDKGSFSVLNNVSIGGKLSKFIYQSSQTSTIDSDAHLKLDKNLTFSYDPTDSISKKLLNFTDGSSVLTLNSASLHATTTGIQFVKGHIRIKGDCCIASEVVADEDNLIIEDNGVTFGDGTVENDCVLEILTGSNLNISQGSFIYKNVDLNSLIMSNQLSTLNMYMDAICDMQESMDLGVGRLLLHSGAELKVANEKQVVGAVFSVD